MHLLKIIPLLLIGFLIASCANTPEKLYKDFYTIQAHKKVGVATDVTILQDGPKNVDILLPELSKKYVKILNNHAMSQMKAKGYGVSSEYISTGLNVPVGAQVFVSTNRAAKTGERITGAHMIKRRGSTPSKIQKYSAEHLFERLMHRSVLSNEAPKTHFPEVKDLGIPQNHYILVVSGLPTGHSSLLGEPIHSEGPKMAQKDIFSFVQGYSTANKASRATLHTVGDILTLGLWEVVGTPAEMIADGSDVRAEVLYDKNVKVKKVTPYKGHNLIKNIDKN